MTLSSKSRLTYTLDRFAPSRSPTLSYSSATIFTKYNTVDLRAYVGPWRGTPVSLEEVKKHFYPKLLQQKNIEKNQFYSQELKRQVQQYTVRGFSAEDQAVCTLQVFTDEFKNFVTLELYHFTKENKMESTALTMDRNTKIATGKIYSVEKKWQYLVERKNDLLLSYYKTSNVFGKKVENFSDLASELKMYQKQKTWVISGMNEQRIVRNGTYDVSFHSSAICRFYFK